jgi:hypothetical protein
MLLAGDSLNPRIKSGLLGRTGALYLRRYHTPMPRKHTLHSDTAGARPTSRPTAS